MNPHTFPFVATDGDGKPVLSVTMRRPTIDDQMEFRAALDKGLSKAITKILTTCTVDASDAGPWLARAGAEGEDPASPIDWARVSSGIRMQALFTLKMNGKENGHLIDVDMVCPNCPKDTSRFTTVVDARPIPDGELLWSEPEDTQNVIEAIVTGGGIETEIGGLKVEIRPPCGDSEQKAEDVPKVIGNKGISDEQMKKEITLRSRAYQLKSVEGVHPNDLAKWVKSLPEDLYDELEAALESIDWGVELSFETTCPKGHELVGEIPFVYLFGRPNTKMQELRKRRMERARKKKPRSASQE